MRLTLDWTKAHDVKPLEQSLTQKLDSIRQACRHSWNKWEPTPMTQWVSYLSEQALMTFHLQEM